MRLRSIARFGALVTLVGALAACGAEGTEPAPEAPGATIDTEARGENGVPASLDPCDLFTPADAKPYIPGAVEQERHDTTKSKLQVKSLRCRYTVEGMKLSEPAAVEIYISKDPFSADLLDERIKEYTDPNSIAPPIEAKEIPGLGEKAYVVGGTMEVGDEVWAVAKNHLIVVQAQDNKLKQLPDEATEIARTVAGRI